MRSKYLPMALVVALGTASVAMAAETANGVIKSVDAAAHSVTLEDGKTYMLPEGTDAATLKVGEKVQIAYDMKDKAMAATSIEMAK